MCNCPMCELDYAAVEKKMIALGSCGAGKTLVIGSEFTSARVKELMERSVRSLHRPVVPKKKKIGRNDMCPCGSGKKHKRCCL
jgi:preprotein translocase subunit SecA